MSRTPMTRTNIVIDESALLHNIQCVKNYTPESPIIAMVKANAYGHGMNRVTQVLAPEVDMFGVACLEEAQALRALMPAKPILLAGGVFSPEEWKDVFEGNFEVVIHSFWQIESLLSFKPSFNQVPRKICVWLKIDTGMHRLGFVPEDVLKAYEKLSICPHINQPIGLMTHFACADDESNFMTEKQLQQFKLSVASLPSQKWSLANSAGIIAWPETRHGYIRPGIMLYGISPFDNKIGKDLGLKPVMCLQSHIMTIKICQAGESVGYGATWRASKISRIATVSVGYGDGYPRHISSEAVVWINNRYFPVVGRVSMDMLGIDVSEDAQIQAGDCVELWGTHLPVEQVARFAGTSPYEVLTQVRGRGF